MVRDPWVLIALFGELSVLAVGGVAPVLPEMMRQVVDVHGYMDRSTFTALYGLAQAAPGPNMLVATVVGLKIAGLPGAFAATAGMVGPSSVLTFATWRVWDRFREHRWRHVVQAGLVPVTVGLVCAGAWLLVRSTATTPLSVGTTCVVAALLMRSRVNPLFLLLGAAIAGILAG